MWLCDLDSSSCENHLIGYKGCFDSKALPIAIEIVFSIEQCVKSCSTKYQYAGIMNG